MGSLGAVIACVAMLTGLPVPDSRPTIRFVSQATLDSSVGAERSAGRRYRAVFWARRAPSGEPEIWLGPRADAATLAHEVTHWLQMASGRPFADHRLPYYVERKYGVWCRERVEAATRRAAE